MKGAKNILSLSHAFQRNRSFHSVYRASAIRYFYSQINRQIHRGLTYSVSKKYLPSRNSLICSGCKNYSSESEKGNKDAVDSISEGDAHKKKSKSQLAKIFAEYGTTAVIFHTTLSLTSLGISYMAVSSGIDVVALLQKLNIMGKDVSTVGGGATTFVIAYACHKVFMPVRTFITVSCTPLIVRKLRTMGILKVPEKS